MRNSRFLSAVAYAILLACAGLLFWATPPHAQYPGYNNPGAYGPNKLRNSTMYSWYHGTSGGPGSLGWCGEGIFWTSSGASITLFQQLANDLASPYNYTVWMCEIQGAASVTDIKTRWIIESYDAASLAGAAITCQFPIRNKAGVSITPTITVYSGGSQDNWGAPNTDVNGQSLGSVADDATTVLTYTWTASATTANGLSIDIDFGNNFSSSAKKIHLGGGFNCRSTPGFPTGSGASSYPQQPDMPSVSVDDAWNRRFYLTTYGNGVAAASVTHSGIQCGFFFDYTNTKFQGPSFSFGTVMRAAPSITFYDGAGSASKLSALSGAIWTDALAITVTPSIVASGFLLPLTSGGGSNTQVCVHYVADATLTGN